MKMAIANILGDGILKASELTDGPWVDYVGTYRDSRNDELLEYRFRAQNEAQARTILREQTEHWAAVKEPSRARSFYVDLKVRRA
jgi:hypothetical protein